MEGPTRFSEGRNPPWYPTPAMIAERWRDDREDNVRYFRNNMQSAIHTFEDDAIQAALAVKREGSPPDGRDPA